MEGVKILNEIRPKSADVWVIIVWLAPVCIGFLVGFITDTNLDKKGRFVAISFCVIIFVLVMIPVFCKNTSSMKYEAIIDDNVRLSEFEKKYEIVEKRGDIYVIKERESNER